MCNSFALKDRDRREPTRRSGSDTQPASRSSFEAAVAAAGGFEWTPGQGPGIRFSPNATRKPGQILKSHVTLEEMMEPGDKPNWGWVDPPKGFSEEEVAAANRQAAATFAEAIGRADELDLDEKESAVAGGRSKEADRTGALANCPICRRTVSSGARVCGGCGTDLCPICHRTVSSNAYSCGACGWSRRKI